MQGAGAYWTSTLGSESSAAYDIDFDGGGFYIDDAHSGSEISRSRARNVRAVYGNQTSPQPSDQPSDQPRDSEGFKYINDFTYIKDLSDYVGSGNHCYLTNCSQHENGNIIKANVFCVENFYGVSEGQSYANMNMYADKGLTTRLGEFNFCWAFYSATFYLSSSRADLFFVDAYDTMEIGESKQLTFTDGTVYTFTVLDKIVSNTNSKKKLVFSVDRPLYFGGNDNGSK